MRKLVASLVVAASALVMTAGPATANTMLNTGVIHCDPKLMSSVITANGNYHYHKYTLAGSTETVAVRQNPYGYDSIGQTVRDSGYYGPTAWTLEYDGYANVYNGSYAYCR